MTNKKPVLEIGRAYFGCGYYLRNLPVPSIQTWIYLGTDIYGEDTELYHYFEDPDDYFEKEISEETKQFEDSDEHDEVNSEPLRMRVADSHLETLICDYEGLRVFVDSLDKEPNADKTF